MLTVPLDFRDGCFLGGSMDGVMSGSSLNSIISSGPPSLTSEGRRSDEEMDNRIEDFFLLVRLSSISCSVCVRQCVSIESFNHLIPMIYE